MHIRKVQSLSGKSFSMALRRSATSIGARGCPQICRQTSCSTKLRKFLVRGTSFVIITLMACFTLSEAIRGWMGGGVGNHGNDQVNTFVQRLHPAQHEKETHVSRHATHSNVGVEVGHECTMRWDGLEDDAEQLEKLQAHDAGI